MVSEKPMDRLICGDVGFEKQKLLWAAFLLSPQENRWLSLHQLLCLQNNIIKHLKIVLHPFPWKYVNYQDLEKSENKKSVLDIENGRVDIIIGTHKLIAGNIKFKDLGLIIIDEEHRFGVLKRKI